MAAMSGEQLKAILDEQRRHYEAFVEHTLTHQLGAVNDKIDALSSDVAGLKGDVAGLKGDVAGLKGDVAGLKLHVAQLDGRAARIEDHLALNGAPRKHPPAKRSPKK
jgi:outer membrane murein-binding lipoprotein Lpp